jgi:hypothetical protein
MLIRSLIISDLLEDEDKDVEVYSAIEELQSLPARELTRHLGY